MIESTLQEESLVMLPTHLFEVSLETNTCIEVLISIFNSSLAKELGKNSPED